MSSYTSFPTKVGGKGGKEGNCFSSQNTFLEALQFHLHNQGFSKMIWPSHTAFHGTPNSVASTELRSLLQTIVNALPEIGYCQAMGPIVAVLLLLSDKSVAFQLSVRLFEDITKDYHSATMEGLEIDICVFLILFKTKLPKLFLHFQKLNTDIRLFVMKWFLCYFLDFLPFPTVLRIWDMLFIKGSPVLPLTALALLKLYKKKLLQCTDMLEINHCLTKQLALTTNWDGLVATLFGIAFPSFESVVTLRCKILENVKKHIDKEAIRRLPPRIRNKFPLEELETMRERFNAIAVHGIVTKAQFPKLFDAKFQELFKDPELTDVTYSQFDLNGDGKLEWKEYCAGFAFLSSGTAEEKAEFWFRTFDANGDGIMELDEFESILKWKLTLMGHPHDQIVITDITQQIFQGVLLRRGKRNSRGGSGDVGGDADSGGSRLEEIDFCGLNREEFKQLCTHDRLFSYVL
eukprot:TRINITY_DN11486_c0_g1_i9.p1 TRINITY_DN11486_c0_g1~~TRINITY_DN11486_c0_g1_i9.p1  ORF type:complete len:461 (-),score=93.40 TRINITY_DN11486_c0_g1_i9:81-1463(-)